MSQRLLKCTIYGGDHSIFHCINKCVVCSCDNRQCSCPAQPPQKRRGRPSRAINSLKISRATKGLKKIRHFGERPRGGGPVLPKPTTAESRACCRVGGTRKRCGGEELANLVQTKSEAIKTLQTKLVDAKRTIAELKAKLKTLRQCTADEPQQQPQQKDATRTSTHSLATIHTRYQRVLQILRENNCSMANAFWLAGCPRSTLGDFIAIAELRILDEREFELASREICVGSVKDL
ncbi:hypothetical protein pdam_00025783 [Pocillopora damicornis]|uniref:Uncharacterized protein n=1 Tax=Pocillopora damicornis TaxID=46731 RepID=A0A3M6UD72_POCDA|nr:hypothetical protein pdam_00025783 [Pocillopora damicornis]